jgi:pyruvate dehydrogenase E2 component (dihydrolipoamide acetyltransferase)
VALAMNGRIIPLSLPKWGLLMTEGTLASWRAPVGASLAAGDPVADIESEKIVNELEAHEPGILRRQLIQAGETCPVGALIGVMTEGDVPDADIDAFIAGYAGADAPREVSIAAVAPRAGAAPAAAGVEHTAAAARREPVQIPAALRGAGSTQNVRATHHATLLAQLWGVDLTQIRGTGNAGQVTKTDLIAAIVSAGGTIDPVAARLPYDALPQLDAERPATPGARRLAAGLGVPLRSVEPHPGERRIRKADVLAATEGTGTERFVERPFSATHRVMARRVAESVHNAPHFRLVIDVRIDELLALGETASGKSGIKVSLNDLLVAASAHVLTTVDGVNVHVLDDRIRQFKDADIAIAVSTAQGLIAPVVRAANSKGIAEIATDARALALKAREGRLSREEVEGGTFTISNLGMFGVREFDAIINPPQGAILAVGAARREKLLAETGAEIVATVMTLTMSCDHRAIDGALGARFLKALKAMIEAPASLEHPRTARAHAPESRSRGMA